MKRCHLCKPVLSESIVTVQRLQIRIRWIYGFETKEEKWEKKKNQAITVIKFSQLGVKVADIFTAFIVVIVKNQTVQDIGRPTIYRLCVPGKGKTSCSKQTILRMSNLQRVLTHRHTPARELTYAANAIMHTVPPHDSIHTFHTHQR